MNSFDHHKYIKKLIETTNEQLQEVKQLEINERNILSFQILDYLVEQSNKIITQFKVRN
jgi:hypothetical protein|tara:strand:- start:15301 stop:15477 length:177 start_codon:yes stop_codon:yes gene_type:complete